MVVSIVSEVVATKVQIVHAILVLDIRATEHVNLNQWSLRVFEVVRRHIAIYICSIGSYFLSKATHMAFKAVVNELRVYASD